MDLTATRQGLSPTRPSTTSPLLAKGRQHLWTLLDTSLLKLWPDERTAIENLIEDAQPFTFLGDPIPSDSDDPYSTQATRTDTASCSLRSRYTGDPVTLRLRTPHLQDYRWPFGSAHYATSRSAARTALRADGFRCATACYRAGETRRSTSTHTTARSSLPTSPCAPRPTAPLLVTRRGAGSAQACPSSHPPCAPLSAGASNGTRVEHECWHGVVEGTPVTLPPSPGHPPPEMATARYPHHPRYPPAARPLI